MTYSQAYLHGKIEVRVDKNTMYRHLKDDKIQCKPDKNTIYSKDSIHCLAVG